MKWLHRLTYLYLLLPFLLFCLGWLRLFIALPVTVLMLWVLWRLWNVKYSRSTPLGLSFIQSQGTLHSLMLAIILTGLWVFLSGVGGYAFQNWDHHWRNAVFHDLISYDWPVVYAAPESGPIKMLVYYVGYWLPSALVGKVLGWQIANVLLLLWTWLGVLLVILHLSVIIKASSLKALILLIIFSGMDALGTIFFAKEYPTLWPPIQHLEIWAGDLQYSSFTTQLFWVFNQAVPAWLCIALFVILSDPFVGERRISDKTNETLRSQRTLPQSDMSGQLIFLWALCFFFAPLASIGLLPYLLIEWYQQTRANLRNPLPGIRLDLLFTSALIFIISYLFFSSNTAAQERGIQTLALKNVLIFFLLEGGILWLLIAPSHWRDPRWALTGILLFVIPFIQLGSGRDFVMRASIAPLFYLMIWAGEALTTNAQSLKDTKNKYSALQIGLFVCLAIGTLTPLYEINRSLYRTFEYYFLLNDEQRVHPSSEPATHLEQGGAPELEHPGSLVADDIQTMKFMDDKLTRNFVANVRQSLYYRYIAR